VFCLQSSMLGVLCSAVLPSVPYQQDCPWPPSLVGVPPRHKSSTMAMVHQDCTLGCGAPACMNMSPSTSPPCLLIFLLACLFLSWLLLSVKTCLSRGAAGSSAGLEFWGCDGLFPSVSELAGGSCEGQTGAHGSCPQASLQPPAA